MDRGRKRRLQQRYLCFDLIDNVERVGAGLAPDQQQFGLPAVVPGPRTRECRRVDCLPNVLDPHRRTVAIGHDQVVKCLRIEQLVVGVERDRLLLALEIAFRLIEGRGAKRGVHVFKPNATRGERGRVHLDMHRILLLPGDIHLRHAGNLRDPLRHDGVGVVIHAIERQRVGVDRVDHDRPIGWVGLLVGRRIGQVLRQQAARCVDGGLHVAGGAVDVSVEIKLQCDAGGAEPAGRRHLGEAGDCGELLLERGRNR